MGLEVLPNARGKKIEQSFPAPHLRPPERLPGLARTVGAPNPACKPSGGRASYDSELCMWRSAAGNFLRSPAWAT